MSDTPITEVAVVAILAGTRLPALPELHQGIRTGDAVLRSSLERASQRCAD